LASAALKAGLAIDWANVRRQLLRTRPPYADNIDALISFVAARSGGIDGHFLQYIRGFHNSLVDPSKRKSIASLLYTVLADSSLHNVSLALWQTAYTCPPEFVKNGMCTWVTGTEASALFRARDDSTVEALKLAEQTLASWRLGLGAAGFDQPIASCNKLLGVFARGDIAMGRYLLKKQSASAVQHADVSAINRYFVSLLKESFPDARCEHFFSTAMPQQAAAASALDDAAASASVPAGTLTLHVVNPDGSLVSGLGLLRQRGFDIGCVATAVNGRPGHWKVVGVDNDRVQLGGLGDNKDDSGWASVPDFLNDYAVGKAADVVERVAGWFDQQVFLDQEARLLAAKGRVLSSLAVAFEVCGRRSSVRDKVELFAKPAKRMKAATDLAGGSLLLTPDTVSVKVIPREEASAGCGFNADGQLIAQYRCRDSAGNLADPFPGHHFVLLPPSKALAPLWFTLPTSDKTLVNVQWDWLQVSSLTGADFSELALLPPPAKSRKLKIRSKSADASANDQPGEEDDVADVVVFLPVLVNPLPISRGTELACFRPAASAKSRPAAAIPVSKLK